MTSKNPVKVTLKFWVSGYAHLPNDADFVLTGSASLQAANIFSPDDSIRIIKQCKHIRNPDFFTKELEEYMVNHKKRADGHIF
jgi:hypothetical protein